LVVPFPAKLGIVKNGNKCGTEEDGGSRKKGGKWRDVATPFDRRTNVIIDGSNASLMSAAMKEEENGIMNGVSIERDNSKL
jgi:hypothetical protein